MKVLITRIDSWNPRYVWIALEGGSGIAFETGFYLEAFPIELRRPRPGDAVEIENLGTTRARLVWKDRSFVRDGSSWIEVPTCI